ncbi:hypothetical protein V6N12_013085 [Hibiscus sabdariffa]|uniref:Putative plant transposon protein domain-containing protein n=1 Tax=Hibiscus sabdariffa TaxID=183260 RepID=A0ABR2EGA6_9ROSI
MLLTNSRTHDQVDFLVSLIKSSSLENELLRFPKPGDNAQHLETGGNHNFDFRSLESLSLHECIVLTSTARYNNIVAAKNKWEEQGFFFEDGLENYSLEPIIYRRLHDLGWFRLGRQVAQANLSWVREFYAHNPEGCDTAHVRGRRVPANSATINTLLDLPDNLPSIYELISALEDVDYDSIKDQLRLPAKLWNTFVKRNLIPFSHNQTVDRTRLVLINAIISGYRFNIGGVIARELSDACQNDKGILAFPCIIYALCRRAAVPSRPSNKYTCPKIGWTRKEYMRKMDLTDATPIQVAMPTPPASHQSQAEPQAPTAAANSTDSPAHTPEVDARFALTPPTPPSPPAARSPPPAPTTEVTPPAHIMQLRNQLQRFFPPQSTTAPPLAASAVNPSDEVGQTEPIHLSGEDIFDWQSPNIAPATITQPAQVDAQQSPPTHENERCLLAEQSSNQHNISPRNSLLPQITLREGDCRFLHLPGRVPDFCSLVYSGGLRRDLFVNSWRLKIQVHRVTEKSNGCRFLRFNPRFTFYRLSEEQVFEPEVVDWIENLDASRSS